MIIVIMSVSKSRFKAKALEYFRHVERTGEELVITDRGRPVLRIVPFKPEPGRALAALRETVVRYDAPTDPVGAEDWRQVRKTGVAHCASRAARPASCGGAGCGSAPG